MFLKYFFNINKDYNTIIDIIPFLFNKITLVHFRVYFPFCL